MNHLDDGTLQAFLDDELASAERAAVAEHLLECERCREAHESLMRANALFAQSVAVLDVEPPASTRVLAARAKAGTSSFVKAAGLVLALAAAASAAVPGSPVRQWIATAVEAPEPAPEPGTTAPEPVAEADGEASAPAPAGLSVPAAEGVVVVALDALEGARVRLEGIAGDRARVAVVGSERDPLFRTRAGRIELRDGAGGEVRVGLPVAVDGARLEVDGRLVAEAVAGELRLLVPADTVDGALILR